MVRRSVEINSPRCFMSFVHGGGLKAKEWYGEGSRECSQLYPGIQGIIVSIATSHQDV